MRTCTFMNVTLICRMFEELPRQGPGLDESTAYASSLTPPIPGGGKILDIGCGSGMQTLTLAKLYPDCMITASDIYQPFLDDLVSRAKKQGLDERILTYQASMDDLPFDTATFDLIWSEGSAFIMGLSNALSYWKQFVKPDGYLVVSDTTWFTDSPSPECRKFLNAMCPDMETVQKTEEMIKDIGYTVIKSFRLPDSGWWDHYYTPLTTRIPMLKEMYADNRDAQEIIRGLEEEMEIHQKYSHEYGYTFFVLQNRYAD
ncbi:MAG: class I SAM-dependent methyltransferase [Methanospirillaceae archaeon]|nr:class I SAM-dependent methyltransferase [Methanospirillaceae archaeon]